MTHELWPTVTVFRRGVAQSAASVLLGLGASAPRGLMAVPGANEQQICVFGEQLDEFIRLCRTHGYEVRVGSGAPPQPATPQERVTPSEPVPPSEEKWVRHRELGRARGARTREQLREELSRVRTRLRRRRTPTTSIPEGDIVMDESGNLRVDRAEAETFRRLVSTKTEPLRNAEDEARKRLSTTRVQKDIADRMADILITQSSSQMEKMRTQLSEMTNQYFQMIDTAQSIVGLYQAEKHLKKAFDQVKSQLTEDGEETRKRKGTFRSYARLFGKDTKFYEDLFRKGCESVLDTLAGQDGMAKKVEEVIESTVRQAAKIDALRRLLNASSLERRAHLRKECEEQVRQIANYDFVTAVSVENQTLLVDVKEVIIIHNSQRWNLGRYRMKIALGPREARSPRIVLFNLDWGSNYGPQGPHITNKGTVICWGNIGAGVKKLHADWNWPLLVHILWNYLHSYTPGDCFNRIETLFEQLGRSPEPLVGPAENK